MDQSRGDSATRTEHEERNEILDVLACVADRSVRSAAVKFQIEEVQRSLSEKLAKGAPHVFEAVGVGLKRCGTELPYKAPMYGTLAGLLTIGKEPYAKDLATKLAEAVSKDLTVAIRDGRASYARRSLRYLVCLSNASVVSPTSIVAHMKLLLEGALFELAEAKRSSSGVHARGEFLADIALSALPWAGSLLLDRVPDELAAISDLADRVAEAWVPGNWRSVACATEKRCVECFSELLRAVEQLKQQNWVCDDSAIPKPYTEFEVQLGGGHEIVLPPLTIPSHSKLTRYSAPRFRLALVTEDTVVVPPVEKVAAPSTQVASDTANDTENDEKGEKAVASGPASADVHMTDKKDSAVTAGPTANGEDGEQSGTEPMESTIAAEIVNRYLEKYVLRCYVADVLDNFATNHVMAAERLLTMPMLVDVNDEIVEGLFSQMCAMPNPSFAYVYYGTLFVDLCRVKDSRLPIKLLAAVERIFQDAGELDPETFDRLTEWFSFHLSNFGYKWNWSDWAVYADPDMVDKFPFRALFCRDVLSRCIRLSYFDRVAKIIPEEMRYFLPVQPNSGDKSRFSEEATSRLMEIITGAGKEPPHIVKEKLVELFPSPAPVEDETPEQRQAIDQATARSRLAALLRAVLLAGCKTLSHFDTVAERYLSILTELSAAGGVAARQLVALEVSVFWSSVHVRRLYVLDKLSTYRVIDGLAIVDSVLTQERAEGVEVVRMSTEELAAALSQSGGWEIIRLVLARACAREDGARSELTIASQAAATATEGDMEAIEARLERAKSGTENAKREINELLTLALRRLFMLCNRLLTELGDADAMDTMAVDAQAERSAEGDTKVAKKKILPGFNGASVWSWRGIGMIRELGRKHPRHISSLLDQIRTDTLEVRERHRVLQDVFEVLEEVTESDILPRVW